MLSFARNKVRNCLVNIFGWLAGVSLEQVVALRDAYQEAMEKQRESKASLVLIHKELFGNYDFESADLILKKIKITKCRLWLYQAFKVIDLKPDQVLVVRSDTKLSRETVECIREDFAGSLPEEQRPRIIVLDPSMHLDAVQKVV